MTKKELALIKKAEGEIKELSRIADARGGHIKFRMRIETILKKLAELKESESVEWSMYD